MPPSAGARMVFRGEHDRRRDKAGSAGFPTSFLRLDRRLVPAVITMFPDRHHRGRLIIVHSGASSLRRNKKGIVPLRFRRDGILPLCRAPNHGRQEGGRYGTEI